jgi:hypothetical protein
MDAVKQFNKRLAALAAEYETWKTHYKDISAFLIPRKGRFLDRDTIPNDGSKRHRDIIDNTGGRALRILAAGMQSGLTSPARPWYKLGLADKDLMEFAPVRQWLEEVRKRMLYVFHRSNFYTSTHNIYYEMGAFGTGAMAIDADFHTVIRCYPFTVGEYYLACGADLRVNSFFRIYWDTVRNVVEKYGEKNCSTSTVNMFKNGNGDKWIQIVHVIEPNPEHVPQSLAAKRKPFRSATYEYKGHGEKFLRESGYDHFPVMAPRWTVTGADVYGNSPGMETLGDIKMLQKMQTKALVALDKLVDPPMNAPMNLKSKGASIIPGGVNYLDLNQGQQAFVPAYQVNPDFQKIEYKIEKVQQAIREGFFADLFLMIANSRKDMTATEVVERHEEKLLMLGPVIERIQPELLDRVIDRTFYLMDQSGMIPAPPEELEGMELEVEYISLLAQAQKMVGVTAIEQVAAFVGNLAAVKPETLDKLDQDEAVDQYADMVGVPPKIIVPDDRVREIRAERAKQMQQQQAMEQGRQLAEGAKTLSQTDTGGNNALSALIGNLGGGSAPVSSRMQ